MQLNFNAATVAPDTGFGEPIPAGWYNVRITETEQKPTKAGNGDWYLSLTCEIIDGQYANRKLFTNLNLRNSNPTAQEIAYKQLSAICHAIGVMQVNDSQELHGKPLKVKVKVRIDRTGEYEPSNEISMFKNINEPVQGATGGGMQAPQMQAPAGFGQQQQPAQQPWQQPQMQQQQPVQQMQQPQQFQQPVQQTMQQPQQQYQPPAQAMQQQQQQQQPMQQQQPQQAPNGAPAQPWEQGTQQPWTQPQPQTQAPVQQPMQQQPMQQMQPAQQNPVVQQMAGTVPPWQQPAQ